MADTGFHLPVVFLLRMLFHLVYVSHAVRPFDTNDLLDLLSKARATNENLGITGLLLYKSCSFMQILEGEEEAVRGLMKRILHDPRHRNVVVFLEGALPHRVFGEWSMAFQDLDTASAQATPGYNRFLETTLPEAAFDHEASFTYALLHTFALTK